MSGGPNLPVGLPNQPNQFYNNVAPEDFVANRQKLLALEQWTKMQQAANDQGLRNHLEQKRLEGERAAFMLQMLDDTITPTATIEELPSPERQPSVSSYRQQNGHQHSSQWPSSTMYAGNRPPQLQPHPHSSTAPIIPASTQLSTRNPTVSSLELYQRNHAQPAPQATWNQNPVPNSYQPRLEMEPIVSHPAPVLNSFNGVKQLSYGISPFAPNPGQQRRAELGGPAPFSSTNPPANGRHTPTANAIASGSGTSMPQQPVSSGRQPQTTNAIASGSKTSTASNALVSNGSTMSASMNGIPIASGSRRRKPVTRHTRANVAARDARTTAANGIQTPTAPSVGTHVANPPQRFHTEAGFTVQGARQNTSTPPISNPRIPSANVPKPAASSSAHLQDRWHKLQGLLNTWQKTIAGEGILDIPMANLRVVKKSGGFMYFYKMQPGILGQQTGVWIPQEEAARLPLTGQVKIYVIKHSGLHALLTEPMEKGLEEHSVPLDAIPLDGAPDAQYPNRPPAEFVQPTPSSTANAQPTIRLPNSSSISAPLPRTPKEVPTTFLAHDLLRALGKTDLYAQDDEYVRYAKQRAVAVDGTQRSVSVSVPVQATLPIAAPIPVKTLPITAPIPVKTPIAAPVAVPSGAIAQNRASPNVASMQTPMQSHINVVKATSTAPRDRVPLFLPDEESKSATPMMSTRRRQAYVLVPPAPDWVKRVKARELAGAGGVGAIEEVPDSEPERERERERLNKKGKGKGKAKESPLLDLSTLKQQRARGWYQNVQNDAEAAAMCEAFDSLRAVPCRWFACGARLNSLGHLVAHLQTAHVEGDVLSCAWENCGRQTFGNAVELALHAETHVTRDIQCAYQDCEHAVLRPADLVVHHRGHVEEGRVRLPSVRPQSVPSTQRPPDPPQKVHGWGVTLPGLSTNVSPQRHTELGPWVLRSISAPTTRARLKRYNATKRLPEVVPDYEFLETSEMQYSSMPSRAARFRDKEMARLDSKEVTALIEDGKLVLWPPEEMDEPTTPEPAAGPSRSRREDAQPQQVLEMEVEESASEATVTGDSLLKEPPASNSGLDVGNGWVRVSEFEIQEEVPRIETIEEDDNSFSTEDPEHRVEEEQVLDMLQDDD
ncbi:hypothetical protein C8F01DRAFT_1119411 [Mycena amicta]|nr:hypothetical protein C8F01DRAFT_1119411 [Mycena amicta]